jgi:DNA-directed RNA polymerase specialized sigma24 family protein
MSMSVIQHLWRERRVRVAGVVEQVTVDSFDDMAAIYQQYWELVYRRCQATLLDHEAALDATHDVFLIALSNFDQVRDDVVRGLLDIARTISYERRHRPLREISLADPPRPPNGSDDPAEIAERHGVLTAVWSGLSPVERRYVADKFAGFSFEEIAKRNHRKLGTVSSNLFRAREHARKMRGPTLPAVLGAAGWRRVTDLCHRARHAAHEASTAAAAQPVQSLTISLTLAGLIAGVAPAATAGPQPGAASRPSAVIPPTQSVDGGDGRVAVASGAATHAGQAARYVAAPSPQPSQPASGSLLPLPASAASETPEDTRMYTATPSPNYEQDHTILALGYGNACQCNVLLRSTDGGAAWTARPGAPDGNQLVLPPDYPHDPGIFVGHSYGNAGTTVWYAPTFDEPFTALAVPGGSVALPAGYDAGDKRVVVSAPTGVVSYSMATKVIQPLVVEPRNDVAPAVATPLGALQDGVLALSSPAAIAPGDAEVPANANGSGMTLWTCPPGSACHVTAAVPIHAGSSLAAAPDFAERPALVAYEPARAVVSQDGGGSFSAMSLPDGTTTVLWVALASNGHATSRWLVAARGHDTILEFSPSLDGMWHEVDYGLPQITAKAGRVVPIGAHHALYFSGSGGFVCTHDDGGHWQSRCPAA